MKVSIKARHLSYIVIASLTIYITTYSQRTCTGLNIWNNIQIFLTYQTEIETNNKTSDNYIKLIKTKNGLHLLLIFISDNNNKIITTVIISPYHNFVY